MHIFEIVVAMLLGGAALAGLARRLGAPYPALVALAGAALALLPGTPTLVLDPQLALALFVAPVLLDAAFDASQRDLRANWKIVTGLAIGAVVLTVVVVAGVTRLLVPRMPWAVAVALGAIVAPPDAAAATAVLKQLRPPHRLLVILEGESLFNDASALLIYRVAVGFAVDGPSSLIQVAPRLLLAVAGSFVLGVVLSRALMAVMPRIEDVVVAIVVQFCTTFAVWTLAERLHLSGILTMVVFAMTLSRRAAALIPARSRIPAFAVWEFAVFVLNVLAFILVGFQLKGIVARVDTRTLVGYAAIAGAVCLATIVARLLWVSAAALTSRRGKDTLGVSGRGAVAVGWCGMRGIVTLAGALALPTTDAHGAAFPYRDLVLFAAFGVVLVTLVVQGMTLRPLIRRLQLRDDGSVDREVRQARTETLRATVLAGQSFPGGALSEIMRRRYELMLARSESGEPIATEVDVTFAQRTLGAARSRLLALRGDGTISDAAFQRVEEELDIEELDIEHMHRPQEPG